MTTATSATARSRNNSGGLKQRLDAIFDASQFRNARWGIEVVDLETSEVLYERDGHKGFMPASNMKLYTTAAALTTLGPNYTYETKLCSNGPIVRNGTLRGDLIVIGSGDPSISGRYKEDTPTTAILQQWVSAVKKAGIRRIEGAVIGDDDAFDDSIVAGSWQLDYYAEWYAAESSGLTMNDNCWDALITPGKKVGVPASLQSLLPTRYVTFKNAVVTTAANGKTSADPDIEILRGLSDNEVTLSGTIALDHEPFKNWGSIHNPTLFCATLLKEELEREGISVRRGAMDIDDMKDGATRKNPEKLKVLHTHVSPPLSRILAIINKPSQNFYADQLLKTIGKHVYRDGSFHGGSRVVRDFLTSAGVSHTSEIRQVDGSGLSRQNLVEPEMTMALLRFMARQPFFDVFYTSLPIMGVDGTLKTRMRGTPAQGAVHAKTGTINSARALSGYLKDARGHDLAFSMMANNYTVPVSAATEAQDKAVLELLAYKGEGR